ncbi:MAG: hypothetical protein HYY65_14680 [Candidatus Tectomicrobia bacterium]|uniref:Cytochrome c-552/4 domain-containing protein n=1 Tax=Tectimicrobiota bacterium TaxID=2528274 RepID=A0A932M2U6_UNCTE|nr:hypothetical protein [Candidatus Tectomicrobia bacterium]
MEIQAGKKRLRPSALVSLGFALGGLGLLLSWTLPQQSPAGEIESFLESHWRKPIPPQGEAPAGYSPLEASLRPEDCGTCHVEQYRAWRTSRHSRGMGPGVLGQVLEMEGRDPGTAELCQSCHAPRSEQLRKLRSPAGSGVFVNNTGFDEDLQAGGLICAACHVRKHRRFGPPPRGGPPESAKPAQASLPHGGFTSQETFSRSEFCKDCHQFREDGFALNGKLLENTYAEWLESSYARSGVTCQGCHMPDRRHLWQGIHSPEMVRQGIDVSLTSGKSRYRPGELLEATLQIANRGTGHFFPTYVTPKVIVRFWLEERAGKRIAGSLVEKSIGREVELDLSREIYDTRIPPGGRWKWTYRKRIESGGLQLRTQVVVYPDHFYTRFFEAVLPQYTKPRERKLIQAALEETRRSRFVVFDRRIPVT